MLRRLTIVAVRVCHDGCKTREISRVLKPRQSANKNKWIGRPTIISAWALILLSSDTEKAHCQPTTSYVWPEPTGKSRKHRDGENELMDHGEPSPRRRANARKRVEPTPPRHSVPRTLFAERRAQVREGHHCSDVSSSESDNLPEPSGLNKKKSSGVAINLVEPSGLNKKEPTGGTIDLVSEAGKEDKAKLNLGRSVSTFHPMEIKVSRQVRLETQPTTARWQSCWSLFGFG